MRSSLPAFGARVVAVAAVALSGAGCSFITGIPNVDRVDLTVSPQTIAVNQQAIAVGTAIHGDSPIRNANRAVSYSSSNTDVASINAASGLIIGLKPGTTDITASSGGKDKTVTLTVQLLQARQLLIATRAPIYRVGATNTITATALDTLNNPIRDRAVTWAARTPTVLTVSSAGVVTPLTTGSSWIVASIDNGPGFQPAVDSVQATVTPPPVISVAVTPNNDNNNTPTVYTGQTLQFSATLTDSLLKTVTRPVVWSTGDNGRVLSINGQTGLARGIAATSGTTTVTATVDVVPNANPPRSIATSVAVAVLAPVDSVRVLNSANADVTSLSVAQGSTTPLTFIAVDVLKNTLPGRTFSLSSGNTAAVTVPATSSGSAQVTAVAAGTATITVQALDATGKPQGKQSTITVTVK